MHTDPQLTLDGVTIPIVKKVEFIELIFDRKLDCKFIPHLKYLNDGGLKLVGRCITYGSARSSYLQALNCTQNGAYMVMPSEHPPYQTHSQWIKIYELPLNLRREKLTSQLVMKLKSTPDNPA